MQLFLNSSSAVHGYGYMDHCEGPVIAFLRGIDRLLFVPHALRDHEAYTKTVTDRFERMGVRVEGLHEAADPVAAVEGARALFIGGGNTFRLLESLYRMDLLGVIRSRVREGLPYLGSSAGSNVACSTMKTTNDMPITCPPSLDALGLVSFQINPHYIDPDSTTKHQGETRDDRIREFHEMNSAPVVGLREGAWLRRDGDRLLLEGINGAKLFRQGEASQELGTSYDLSFLL